MPEYIASSVIHADYYECMTFMPDSTPHRRTCVFEADNEAQARKIAIDKFLEVGKDLFNPRPALESLMEYRPVNLNPEPSLKPKPFQQKEFCFTISN